MTRSIWRTHVELLVPEIRDPILHAMDMCIDGMEPEAIVAALFNLPEPVRLELAELLDPRAQNEAIALAYGFLWRVQGDASKDENIRLAYTARHALLACLSKDEQRTGIELAKQGVPQ